MIERARVLAAVACLMIGAPAAHAQAYPTKPITIIVPAAPGGVTDALGRILAQKFTDAWGQQSIVENKPGANNQIAAEYVAKSAPDGHTLFIGPEVTFVVNPSLYCQAALRSGQGFHPDHRAGADQSRLHRQPVAAGGKRQGRDRARPGRSRASSTTAPSASARAAISTWSCSRRSPGVKFQAVHYKGATPALTDVVAGHIQMMFISVGSAVPQAKAGKVKLLAVGAGKRMELLPEAPTVAEGGIAGLRGRVLVRPVRAGRNAARDRRQGQRRGAPRVRRGRVPQERSSTASISNRSPARRKTLPPTSSPRSRNGAR